MVGAERGSKILVSGDKDENSLRYLPGAIPLDGALRRCHLELQSTSLVDLAVKVAGCLQGLQLGIRWGVVSECETKVEAIGEVDDVVVFERLDAVVGKKIQCRS